MLSISDITDDVRIESLKPLIAPALLMEESPITQSSQKNIIETRSAIAEVLQGLDQRMVVVVGPCSIHDPQAALNYAAKLQPCFQRYYDDLLIVMRVYFEKPRTTVGWKGLINDPNLDNTFNINKGLKTARQLLLDINNLGLPAGTELLDTIVPQYISDLLSWSAIGARTTESQIHRELASGLSMPLGFKNGTNGNTQIAIDAIDACRSPHHFLSVTKHGLAAIVSTKGNDTAHVILRGGNDGPNFENKYIEATKASLKQAQLPEKIMVDCSHGNSQKDHRRQALVLQNICQQLNDGENGLCGVMLESNLVEGKQTFSQNTPLTYGQSITDACIGWQETENLLEQLALAVRKRRGLTHGKS